MDSKSDYPASNKQESNQVGIESEPLELEKQSECKLQPFELYHSDEGWRAYLCLLGSFFALFSSFGYVNVIGMFNAYLKEHELASYSQSTIGWITSMESFLMIFPGIIIGPVYDIIGPRPLLILGTAFLFVGTMTTSVCTTYYQFMLAQGICTAIGQALLFSPAVAAVSGWFIKKRAVAIGITASGSSIGGVVMPVMFRQIQPRAGFAWAIRSLSFLTAGLALISCFTVTSRIRRRDKFVINFHATYITPFKSVRFDLIIVGIFLVYWGIFIPIGYIPSQATANGMSISLAFYLVSIQNAASIFGRILPGVLADKIGAIVTFSSCVTIAGILILALWLPAKGNVPIIIFAGLFGFFSGVAVSLWPAIIVKLSPIKEIGARIGLVSATSSFAVLTSSPIAGALISHNGGSYWGTSVFAGISAIAGATIVFMAHFIKEDNQ
ncbi:major facilitator superfamily domain-containing protein [Lipomyces oligophaga]|uniref:major facilitator superfamily domain-containing protein n=1 Tax=Lipomyces oligophaga TaxID=45792 RepID=UPI0034CE1BF9